MKRAALSAASASIAPPRCNGLLAISPTGRPCDARQRGVDADAEAGAQFEHAAAVGQAGDARRACRRLRSRFSGTSSRSASASGASPWRGAALEEAEVALRRRHGLRLVVDQQVDHAVGRLHAAGPMSSGRKRPARRPRSSPGRPCRCWRAWR
jgi:hypothetical protein